MDDHVQLSEALVLAEVSLEREDDQGLSVAFNASQESCSFQGLAGDHLVPALGAAMTKNNEPDLDDSCTPLHAHKDDIGSKRYSTVTRKGNLQKTAWWSALCPSCFRFFNSYRSHTPHEMVTPFAIILLLVLFLIYVLNQADRLVLAVSIPAGLRCESKQSQCENKTKEMVF